MPSESFEDILSDAVSFLEGKPVITDEIISYGPLRVTVAPKEGKANTLLADNLFSPSLLLTERIERGLIPLRGKTVIELGAGCSLPSLASCIISDPSNVPSLVVTSDYPDPVILENLKHNIERNQILVSPSCKLHYTGYEWGQGAQELLAFLPSGASGFEIVILSDLLHFHASHDALIKSVSFLLKKTADARVFVAAGKYTRPAVCSSFMDKAAEAGLTFEEHPEYKSDKDGSKWLGSLSVSDLDEEALGVRKGNCRFWVGRWRKV
ncbi:hypothetical protein BDP27DRAFT_1294528 [Rhodocollybia butyracea]|uniref:Uncharacterized protein n=1 Tax=Rhodocollybia butyracea TaxID=206335 RepID=A0A9P5PTD1_9AGAR|nr:hypothetical protein BDP27DRAFT_1294528 [Rhodocollybia butyracea]